MMRAVWKLHSAEERATRPVQLARFGEAGYESATRSLSCRTGCAVHAAAAHFSIYAANGPTNHEFS